MVASQNFLLDAESTVPSHTLPFAGRDGEGFFSLAPAAHFLEGGHAGGDFAGRAFA
jgi:hypothetical protein